MNDWKITLQAQARGLLPPESECLHIEVVETIDSSNSELMRRGRSGNLCPSLLWAKTQSAGRGRLGRSWQSTPGDSLCFSLGLMLKPLEWQGLSLAVGLSLAQHLDPMVRIKWPNDLWIGQQKIGGILIETLAAPVSAQEGRWTVIGVGINLKNSAQYAAANTLEGRNQAGDLATLLTPDAAARAFVNAPELALAQLVPPLLANLRAFALQRFAPLQAVFAQYDLLRNQEIVTSLGQKGIAEGVNSRGAYLLRDAASIVHTIDSAELSLRPV